MPGRGTGQTAIIVKTKELNKTNQVLIFVALIIVALYFGAPFLIPFAFAVLFSTLVLPFSTLLERRMKLGRGASSFLSTLLIFIAAGLVFYFLIQQVVTFVNDVVDRREEILGYLQQLQEGIAESTGFQLQQQEDMLKERWADIINTAQKVVSSFVADATGILGNFLLMLVYVFLLLLYRGKMVEFIMMYVSKEQQSKTAAIITKTSRVAHHYLWGRIQVMILLAIMYIILFTAYDLEHTALLVFFGALITIIPYIGPLLSGVLPILFMLLYGHSLPAVISFTAIIVVIQMIESYVLEPVIIGSEVEQNPLFVIIAVLLGGAIWGLPGLILFVPLFSILKIIFDHSPSLKPVGFLMGYEGSGSGEGLVEKLKRKIKGKS